MHIVTIGSTSQRTARTSWSMTGGTAEARSLAVGWVGTAPGAYGSFVAGGGAKLSAQDLWVAAQGRACLIGGVLRVRNVEVATLDKFLFNDGVLVFVNFDLVNGKPLPIL